jgi:hypothetical protein
MELREGSTRGSDGLSTSRNLRGFVGKVEDHGFDNYSMLAIVLLKKGKGLRFGAIQKRVVRR